MPPASGTVASTVDPDTNSTLPLTGTEAVTVAVSSTRVDEPNTWLVGDAVSVVVEAGMPRLDRQRQRHRGAARARRRG